MRLQNCGIKLSFDYKAKSDPELLDDTGSGSFWVKDLNLTVLADYQVKKDYFQVHFEDIEIFVNDFNLVLT